MRKSTVFTSETTRIKGSEIVSKATRLQSLPVTDAADAINDFEIVGVAPRSLVLMRRH
jgi:hypothetical protein